MTYKPDSYTTLVTDATNAVLRGREAGLSVMEVEFPAVAGVECVPLFFSSS
jgi:hypothetical protein